MHPARQQPSQGATGVVVTEGRDQSDIPALGDRQVGGQGCTARPGDQPGTAHDGDRCVGRQPFGLAAQIVVEQCVTDHDQGRGAVHAPPSFTAGRPSEVRQAASVVSSIARSNASQTMCTATRCSS